MLLSQEKRRSIFSAFLAFIILMIIGFVLFLDPKPLKTELTEDMSVDVVEPELPLTLVEVTPTTPNKEQTIDEKAATFVESLADKQAEPISTHDHQDKFVRYDSVIKIPDMKRQVTTIESLLADEDITDDTVLTFDYTTTTAEQTTWAELSDRYDDKHTPITILDQDGQAKTKPLSEYFDQYDANTDAVITLLNEQQHTLTVTGAELNNIDDIDNSETVAVTIRREGEQLLPISDIVKSDTLSDDTLFYLHHVTRKDQQGLWGIIQAGLTEQFRQGVHIGDSPTNKESVQLIIPADADEKLASGLSSFLGKIINEKAKSSYVYNFNNHTMGRDPDKIRPGQQLVLIHFTIEELTQIYQFFSDHSRQGTTVFTVSH